MLGKGMNLTVPFCSVLVFTAALAAAAADKPVWTWQEPDTELYQPCFSPDGREIAVVRKSHIPDYAEAESLSAEELKKRRDPIEKEERYADPEVIVLKIGNKDPVRVDWGWSPAFSPDGSRIAFAHQKKPISRFRVLAETLKGNDIRLYNRADQSVRLLVEPPSGFLDSPVFSPDGSRIVYAFGDAINGAYGGEVGVGQVSLDGKVGEPLYAPTKDHGLFHLVSSPHLAGNRVLVTRSKPTSGGVHLAESYVTELLDLGPPQKSLFTWPGKDPFEEVQDFVVTPDNDVLVFEGTWHSVSAKPDAAKEGAPAGSLSPDAKLMAVIGESTIDIVDRASGKTLRQLELIGSLQGAVWSPDSKRLAVIGSKLDDEKFETDVLQVFDVGP
jgi:dipeptidyl aminopeptidase/acylaminoacyl peptidase